MPKITLHCGDCLKFMKSMPDKSIDLVLTDPPFGINYKSNVRLNKFDEIEGDCDLSFLPEFINESYRILKDNTAFYCFTHWLTYPEFQQAIKNKFTLKNCLVAPKAKRSMHGDMQAAFAPFYDMIIYANKGRRVFEETKFRVADNHSSHICPEPYIGYVYRYEDLLDTPSTINDNSAAKESKHPTMKNPKLLEFFCALSSCEGDTVFDPYMGSGSVGVACKILRRNFIGCEIVPKYFALAKRRIDSTEWGLPFGKKTILAGNWLK